MSEAGTWDVDTDTDPGVVSGREMMMGDAGGNDSSGA